MPKKIKKTQNAPVTTPIKGGSALTSGPHKKVAILIFGLLIVFLLGVLAFKVVGPRMQKPSGAETDELITKVAGLIDLPQESPTIATVSDKNELKDQPFFAKAENGDKVLIYAQARKAYLYRPSTHKIIEVAPINIAEPSQGPNASPEAQVTETPSRVAIYNGSGINGYAGKIEAQITTMVPNIVVVEKGNAKSGYKQSIVVDLTGKNEDISLALVENLRATLGSMPSDEVKPDADILLILGSDR